MSAAGLAAAALAAGCVALLYLYPAYGTLLVTTPMNALLVVLAALVTAHGALVCLPVVWPTTGAACGAVDTIVVCCCLPTVGVLLYKPTQLAQQRAALNAQRVAASSSEAVASIAAWDVVHVTAFIDISILCMDGTQIRFELSGLTQTRQLKVLVERQTGIKAHLQKLFEDSVGELADDFSKINELGTKGPLVLHLVVGEGAKWGECGSNISIHPDNITVSSRPVKKWSDRYKVVQGGGCGGLCTGTLVVGNAADADTGIIIQANKCVSRRTRAYFEVRLDKVGMMLALNDGRYWYGVGKFIPALRS